MGKIKLFSGITIETKLRAEVNVSLNSSHFPNIIQEILVLSVLKAPKPKTYKVAIFHQVLSMRPINYSRLG